MGHTLMTIEAAPQRCAPAAALGLLGAPAFAQTLAPLGPALAQKQRMVTGYKTRVARFHCGV